jgi:hypothetical protein
MMNQLTNFLVGKYDVLQVPVTSLSTAWDCSPSSAEIVVSNPTGGWMLVICVVCCHVEVTAAN